MNYGIHQPLGRTITPPMPIPGHERRMGIDEVTARAGVSERLVRHCEARGLVARAEERDASWSGYTHQDVCVLRFVRQAHVLGFGMNEAARLLSVWQEAYRVGSELDDTTAVGSMNLGVRIDEHHPIADFVERLANSLPSEHQAACSILEEMFELGARTRIVTTGNRTA